MTSKKTERSAAESLVRRLGFIAEQAAGQLQNQFKQDWRRRQAGVADGVLNASAASLATISDFSPGSDGHLEADRDPRVADEEGIAVFLHRFLIRALVSQKNRSGSLELHKAYVYGVQHPVLLKDDPTLPSVLIVPADRPECMEENLQDSFHASPCSVVMTIVNEVVIDERGDLPGIPQFDLRSVMGSVIVDLRPGLRQADHQSGYDACLVWREVDGGDPFQLRYNEENLPALFHDPYRIELLTGRDMIRGPYVDAVNRLRGRTVNGLFGMHDRVSAIEVVRSLTIGQTGAWLLQPGSVSTWILGSLVAAMWGLNGRVGFYNGENKEVVFWRNRRRGSASEELPVRRAEREGCLLVADDLDHDFLVEALTQP